MKGGMGGLLKQAQKMQKEIERIQNELANIKIEGAAGGGMVTAVANGAQELLEIRIESIPKWWILKMLKCWKI